MNDTQTHALAAQIDLVCQESWGAGLGSPSCDDYVLYASRISGVHLTPAETSEIAERIWEWANDNSPNVLGLAEAILNALQTVDFERGVDDGYREVAARIARS